MTPGLSEVQRRRLESLLLLARDSLFVTRNESYQIDIDALTACLALDDAVQQAQAKEPTAPLTMTVDEWEELTSQIANGITFPTYTKTLLAEVLALRTQLALLASQVATLTQEKQEAERRVAALTLERDDLTYGVTQACAKVAALDASVEMVRAYCEAFELDIPTKGSMASTILALLPLPSSSAPRTEER